MKDIQLKSVEFRNERQEDWAELEHLISEAEKHGLGGMKARDVARLPVFYRAALSSLSVARAISLDANLLQYLENLCNRAFIRMYGVRHHLGEVFIGFITRRFPGEVRRFKWLMLISLLAFSLGMAVGYVQVIQDADNYYLLVSNALADGRNPGASTEDLRAFLYDEDSSIGSALSLFASFLFTHNTQVGILCFALGFALGLPVFYLLFTNGLMLGAMGALYHQRGLSLEFWGWILPHGITEIGAIILCGGAGFALAQALVFPGRSSRLENLATAGKRAGLITLGCVLLFAVAGLIEGFFRQMVHSDMIRYTVAGFSLVMWGLYFTLAGDKGKNEPH